MILNMIKDVRSHRSFTSKKVELKDLEKMIEAARYSSSARNSQGIRYFLISDQNLCDRIFELCKFAGAIEWNPKLDESPRGYILMCSRKNMNGGKELLYFDMGIASQNILLQGREMGYSGCILGAYNKIKVDELVELSPEYESHFLIALGEAKDKVIVVEPKDNDLKYYRVGDDHYVPKIIVENLIIGEK